MVKVINNHIISYAQNREDIIIDAFFKSKKSGFYVDIGANHPVHDSVTKLFYQKGWTGINIEPNPSLVALLELDRPKDTTLQLAISDTESTQDLRLYEGSDGLSTIDAEEKKDTNPIYAPFKKTYTDVSVSVTTLEKLLQSLDIERIDFMKIDVEGHEYEVVKGNDWKKFRPELICIEANHARSDWKKLLSNNNYVQFFNDGLNDYYATEESLLRKDFAFPESVFMTYPQIIPFTPNSDKEVFNEDFYVDKKKSEIEPLRKASTKIKLRWAFSSIDGALMTGFSETLIKLKKQKITEFIRTNLQEGTGMSRNISLFTPKIFTLRILMFVYSKFSKVLRKLNG